MRFDKLTVQPCSIQSADNPIDCTVPGEVAPPTCDDLDVCCADPAYAAEHPEECANRVRLILKPEFVSKPVLQQVQYKTFLVNSIGQETELTLGLEYAVADNTIGIIGSASGNLTTLKEGVTTVRVTWQNLSAQAQLNVVAECQDSSVGMLLLIDISKSMNQQFSVDYATKLSYAKTLARRFAGEINTTKDKVGLASFADTGKMVTDLTNDTATVQADISSLASTQSLTDLNDGLRAALEHLDTQTVDRKVIIIFSDGAKNDGDDPLPLAQSFKDAGGLIIVVAVRSFGVGYAILQKIASAGFLLSSYDSTNDDENSDFLSGMKGYFCAGNCVPAGDIYKAQGALSFKAFKEWDVDGDVDLIGDGYFDFLPGNGLYVDMAGSGPPWKGKLISKRTFTLENLIVYRLQLKLAGNQRIDRTPYTVRVTVGALSTQDITITDWQQPFTTYSYDVTGDGSIGNRITIELIDVPTGTGAEAFGPLLDNVRFDRITATSALLLFSDFDTENEQYIEPGCGEPPEPPPEGQQLINVKATGPTWIPRAFRTGGWFASAMKSDGAIMYVGEFGAKIVKSADSGVTWANTTAVDHIWRGLACSNDAVVVIGVGALASVSGSTDVQVYVSTDTGGTWTARTVEAGYNWAGVACDSTGVKMVVVALQGVSGLGYLYTSVDTGVNWVRRDAAGTVGWLGVAMSADGTKIVGSYVALGTLKISVDSGVAWTDKVIAGAGYLRDVRMTGDGTKIVCCDDDFIYLSTDGGTNFTKLAVGTATTSYPWVRLSISDDGQKIVAGAVDQFQVTGVPNRGVLAVSVDGGTAWRRSHFGHSYWMNAIARNGSLAIAGASFEAMVLAGSVALDPLNVKKGAAVIGNTGDYWNEWNGETPLMTTIIPERLFYSDGSEVLTNPDIVMSQMTGGYDWAAEVAGTQSDPLMKRYLKTGNYSGPGDWKQCANLAYFGNAANGCRYLKISGLPKGNWDFYIYGHGDANNENSRFRLTTDFDDSVLNQTAEGSGMTGTWLNGVHYVYFDKVHVGQDEAVYLFLLPPSGNSGGIQYNVFQGLQIKWVQPPVVLGNEGDGCYGTGCLDEPPPEQAPDPNPQPDIEQVTD